MEYPFFPRDISNNSQLLFSFKGKPEKEGRRDVKANWLGNVNVVVSDKKQGVDSTGDGVVDFYRAWVMSIADMYPGGMEIKERTYNNNSYRNAHGGQEKTDEISGRGNHYTALFWEYDSRLLRRWNKEPLTYKMPSWSPYSTYLCNPIKFIDIDGKEPTPAEAARMAAHVYGDKKDEILIGGWRVSNRDFGIQLQDATGLKSLVYERVVDGKVTEYTYATAGTENGIDWKENAMQPLGLSDQYHSAANNAKKISIALGEIELSYVGHSLGGGQAALNSLITYGDGTGRKAFTFNAAGAGEITKVVEGTWKTPFKSEKTINAYILITDPLNILQNNSPLMPDVNGKRNYLLPKDLPSLYNGHSVNNIIKNFGVTNPDEFKKQ